MKKILLILSALLITFSACGKTNYNTIVKESEAYLQKLADDDEDMEIFSIGELSKEEIKTRNRVLELKDVDFKIKNTYDIIIGSEDYTQALTIIKYEGDVEDYFESRDLSTTYCLIDDVVIIDYNSSEDIEVLCDEFDGNYEN